jgi:hypothetical protein
MILTITESMKPRGTGNQILAGLGSQTWDVRGYPPGGFMDILAALRQEEAKFEKQVNVSQQQLDKVRAAMKLLGGMGQQW